MRGPPNGGGWAFVTAVGLIRNQSWSEGSYIDGVKWYGRAGGGLISVIGV